MSREPSHHQAARARDAGLARLRSLTGAAIAGAVVLSGVFAGIAANATHPRKLIRRTRAARSTPASTSIPALPPARAPSAAATPAPAPAPPAAPPAAAPAQPPVAVTGGT